MSYKPLQDLGKVHRMEKYKPLTHQLRHTLLQNQQLVNIGIIQLIRSTSNYPFQCEIRL